MTLAFGQDTQLIWNCTASDPKTQCRTTVLENGTLLVENGKPEPVQTTTGESYGYSGVPVTEEPFGQTTVTEDGTDNPYPTQERCTSQEMLAAKILDTGDCFMENLMNDLQNAYEAEQEQGANED